MPELQLYGDIGEDYWSDPATWITAKTVSAWLKQNAVGATDITVRINSYGGVVSDGVAIYNLLTQHPAHVTCVVDGFALSAASVIAMAGDEIQMLPGTMMMIHPASGMAWGTAEDLENTAKALRAMSDASAGIYAARTGKSKEECLVLMDAETWFQPEQALAEGFCDKVVPGKTKSAETASARGGVGLGTQRWVAAYKRAPDAVLSALKQFGPSAIHSAPSQAKERPRPAQSAQKLRPARMAALNDFAPRAIARVGKS